MSRLRSQNTPPFGGEFSSAEIVGTIFEKNQIVGSFFACHDVSTTYEIELAIAVFTSTFRVRCSVDLHSLIDANSNAGNRAAA